VSPRREVAPSIPERRKPAPELVRGQCEHPGDTDPQAYSAGDDSDSARLRRNASFPNHVGNVGILTLDPSSFAFTTRISLASSTSPWAGVALMTRFPREPAGPCSRPAPAPREADVDEGARALIGHHLRRSPFWSCSYRSETRWCRSRGLARRAAFRIGRAEGGPDGPASPSTGAGDVGIGTLLRMKSTWA